MLLRIAFHEYEKIFRFFCVIIRSFVLCSAECCDDLFSRQFCARSITKIANYEWIRHYLDFLVEFALKITSFWGLFNGHWYIEQFAKCVCMLLFYLFAAVFFITKKIFIYSMMTDFINVVHCMAYSHTTRHTHQEETCESGVFRAIFLSKTQCYWNYNSIQCPEYFLFFVQLFKLCEKMKQQINQLWTNRESKWWPPQFSH